MATILHTDFNKERDNSVADEADRTRALTAQETEWKLRINERLLTVLDWSLIDTVESDKANKEIREIAERLLPLYVRNQLFRGLVETAASEHGARRIAMKSATDNAGDIIQHLQRTFNKQRQAQITQEIAEIVGGAASLG